MPIFVWIYRITWIRDKAGFFPSFLFSCLIDIIVILKVHENGQNFICILIFKCKTLGKYKVPLVKTLFQKCFCQTPQKNIWSKGWISLLKLIFTQLNFWNYSWSTKCSISSMVIEKLIKCTWQEQISQMKVRRKGMQKSHVYKSTLKNPMLEEPWFDFLKKINREKGKE